MQSNSIIDIEKEDYAKSIKSVDCLMTSLINAWKHAEWMKKSTDMKQKHQSIEMLGNSNNHITQPTNDTKRKIKETMTDSSQATYLRKAAQNAPSTQTSNHNARQDPLNTTIT